MSRSALIIAHGQPSAPAPAEAEMADLAQAVARHLPGWQVGAATLAAPGTLKDALQSLDNPLVFPFFMADGWFIRSLLPKRLSEAGADHLHTLRPFGLMPETQDLIVRLARDAVRDAGWDELEATLILAAHGSGRSRFPAEAARMTEAAVAARTAFADVRTGFIEEPPLLADTLRGAGPAALCLPLFVARWGHVAQDIPHAAKEAGFAGRLLDPVGVHHDVPKIIAHALAAA